MKVIIILFLFACSSEAAFRNRLEKNDFKSLFKTNLRQPRTTGNKGSAIANLSRRCQQYQALGSALGPIFQNYMPVIWPAITFPVAGVVIGAYATNSIINDLCDFAIKFERLTGRDLLFLSTKFLNYLTDNQWAEELNLVNQTYNTASSIYDPTSGEFRKGALTAANTHRNMARLITQSQRYYSRKDRESGGDGIETRSERRREANKIARLAYKNAILQEFTECPESRDRTNYLGKYNKTVPDELRKKDESERAYEFFYSRLILMGKDMMSSRPSQDFAAYTSELNDLISVGARLRQEQKSVVIGVKDELTGTEDEDGIPERTEREVKKKVNVFDVFLKEQDFTEFINKYNPIWQTYISRLKYTSGIRGLLDNKEAHLTLKYRQYRMECSRYVFSLGGGRNLSEQEFEQQYKIFNQQCNQRTPREQDVENLYRRYFDNMRLSLLNYYQAQANIWNFEAENLGIVRDLESLDPADAQITQIDKNTQCSTKMEIGEFKAAVTELKKVNAEIKETILINKQKKLMIREAKAQAEADEKQLGQDQMNKAKKELESNDQTDKYIPSNVRLRPRW